MISSLLRYSWLFGVCCLLLAACQSAQPAASNTGSSSASAKPDSPLLNTRWVVRQLNGAPVTVPEGGRELYLLLRLGESHVAEGNAGCNRFSGRFVASEPNGLSISNLLSTKMACPQLDTENLMMRSLEQVTHYELHSDNLALYGSDSAQPLLTLQAVVLR
ncbi:META domain-containing protein [Hymenobacter sp. BT491]|uniref:META domain-containing protein n=1 Tax=Hymenobacter sp. BT491 TaxID=2766779 RepID=UPI0016539B12|nr:META domain-containing protein [Hymenobacter sp. BT491]MBC6989125.1 META domain-containing protein [Hymenobacter sp. BT491]